MLPSLARPRALFEKSVLPRAQIRARVRARAQARARAQNLIPSPSVKPGGQAAPLWCAGNCRRGQYLCRQRTCSCSSAAERSCRHAWHSLRVVAPALTRNAARSVLPRPRCSVRWLPARHVAACSEKCARTLPQENDTRNSAGSRAPAMGMLKAPEYARCAPNIATLAPGTRHDYNRARRVVVAREAPKMVQEVRACFATAAPAPTSI